MWPLGSLSSALERASVVVVGSGGAVVVVAASVVVVGAAVVETACVVVVLSTGLVVVGPAVVGEAVVDGAAVELVSEPFRSSHPAITKTAQTAIRASTATMTPRDLCSLSDRMMFPSIPACVTYQHALYIGIGHESE